MSLVLAIDDVKPDRVKVTRPKPNPGSANTFFFTASSEAPDLPTAFLVDYVPGRFSGAHYHPLDQFQVIVKGKGTFGRHHVTACSVHFSRAYTPYGPLQSDKETSWSFLTLRSRPGGSKLTAWDKLKQMPDRQPWQITKKIAFPPQGSGISLQHDPDIKDDLGLFTCALTMAPDTRTTAPDPSGGDGQYIVVLKGSFVHDNREHKALALVFVKPSENAFQLQAGAQGLEALVLNLPQFKPRRPTGARGLPSAGFKKWQCALCSFAYDESLGMPEDGLPAGTRWKDVPDSWSCPDCSASKSDFQMVEV